MLSDMLHCTAPFPDPDRCHVRRFCGNELLAKNRDESMVRSVGYIPIGPVLAKRTHLQNADKSVGSGSIGMPGSSDITIITADDMPTAFGYPDSCRNSTLSAASPRPALETSRPAAIETINACTWVSAHLAEVRQPRSVARCCCHFSHALRVPRSLPRPARQILPGSWFMAG